MKVPESNKTITLKVKSMEGMKKLLSYETLYSHVLCVMGMSIVQWETWSWIQALLENYTEKW